MATAGDANTIGKYRLVNCLASGNSSQVWEVVDSETTRRAAMKLLLPEKLTDAASVSALKHEFHVGSNFDHPNIIKYHELSVKKKQAYFTMDLFAAPSLKVQLFNDIRSVQIRLRKLIELVAMALEHVHEKGWLHRDLKPDNILMNKSAEVRLIDFSLGVRSAGALSKLFHVKKSIVQGTRTYMSPEQILGKPLTNQTDIYNFGVTIFEFLTGQAPFKGATPKDLLMRHIGEPCPAPSEFNPNVTPEMSLLVQRMMSKKPSQRHKNMAEFMAEFRNVVLFKEEVTEKIELTDKEKAEQDMQANLSVRLDSRTDHLRTQYGVAAPPPKKKKQPTLPATTASKPGAAGQEGTPPATQPAVPQAPMPQMPMGMPQPMMAPGAGGFPPQYPGMMPPGMMPPNMMPPGMVPQGMMQPGMMQPGMFPGMAGGGVPGGPAYPGMPSMPGQSPWVAAGTMPGMQPAPWGQQPVVPPPQVPMPGRAPAPPQAVVPGAPPQRPTPVPPQAVVPPSVAPLKPSPAAPIKPQQKSTTAKQAPPAAKSGDGFNIGDLAGFDDLPPVS